MVKKKEPSQVPKKRTSGLGMNPHEFMISASLDSGPKHGYAIQKQVRSLTAGRVSLPPGTLYSNLHTMQDQGLIKLQATNVADGRAQKVYQLTDQGQANFNEQANIMKALFSTKDRKEKQK